MKGGSAMGSQEHTPSDNKVLEHIHDLFDDFEISDMFCDDYDGPVAEYFPVPEDPAVDQAVADMELLFSSVLMVYLHDRDRCLFEGSLRALASCASALPAELLRSTLNITSQRVDALLSFTDLWQPPCWKDMMGDQPCDLGEADSSALTQEGENTMVNAGGSVPFIAFLLAGTDFPFSKEELTGIRSASGTTVAEIRQTLHGKEGAEK